MAQAKVSMAVAEKVGLPNYSNVDIGPAVVERYVEDNPDAIRLGLAECLLHAQEIVFREAGEVRRRDKPDAPRTLDTVLTTVTPGSGELTMDEQRRLSLHSAMDGLDEIRRSKLRTQLVGWGVTNVNSRAEILRSLPVEKVSELEEFLNSLKEEMNGAVA